MKTAIPQKAADTGTTVVAGHTLERSTVALLATLGLGVFAGALDLSVLSPAIPQIAGEFGVTARDVAFVVTLYLLANVASIPVATKMADRYGRRPVYIACVAIFAVGSVLAIMAPTFPMFLVARGIQAAGAGGIFPVATAAISDRVPKERRGAALGILGAIWGVAGILGPVLGGILTNVLSWRWIFLANVPLAVIVIFMAQRHVPPKALGTRGPLDIAGIVLQTIALTSIMIGLTRIDRQSIAIGSETTTIFAICLGLAAAVALLVVEQRAIEPVISPKLLANRQISVTYGLEILIGAVEGSLFFVPAALAAGAHLNALYSGLIAALGAIAFVGVVPLAGRALDVIGARAVLSAGTIATAAGLGLFAFGYHTPAIGVLSMLIAGLGFGALLGAPTRYIISQEAPESMRSNAIGLLSVCLIIGQILGSSLAGGLIGSASVTGGSYRVAYVAFAALALLGFGVTQLLAPYRRTTTV